MLLLAEAESPCSLSLPVAFSSGASVLSPAWGCSAVSLSAAAPSSDAAGSFSVVWVSEADWVSAGCSSVWGSGVDCEAAGCSVLAVVLSSVLHAAKDKIMMPASKRTANLFMVVCSFPVSQNEI